MRALRGVLFSVAATSLVFLSTLNAHAQMPPSSSTTSTPIPGVGHDYLGEIAETVNPATGSISIRISAMTPPGRGLTLPFSFAYDSNGVNYVGAGLSGSLGWQVPSSSLVSTGGWSESAPMITVNELTWTATTSEGRKEGCYGFVNYVYQDVNGNRHNLNLTNYKGNTQSDACTYDQSDWPSKFGGQIVTNGGEGPILASIPTTGLNPGPVGVSHPDGTSLYFPNVAEDVQGTMATSIEDRNGNFITITPPTLTSGAFSYLDTAGRTVLQDSGFAVSPENVTISGLGAAYTLTWSSLTTPTFSVPVTTLYGSCSFGGAHPTWNSVKGVSSLKLPNGKSFSFSYDPVYEVINKLTYPTGGYVRYVWGINQQAEWGQSQNQGTTQCAALYGVPVITDRYVSFDGSTEVLHQQFSYSPTTWHYGSFGTANWTSKQTTVTTNDLVRGTSYATSYTYSPISADRPPIYWFGTDSLGSGRNHNCLQRHEWLSAQDCHQNMAERASDDQRDNYVSNRAGF
jgi:hypothetical protein